MKSHSFNSSYLWLFVLLSLVLFITSCKKFIEVDPPVQEIVGKEVFNSNTTAASVLTGIYMDMSNYGIFSGRASISVRTGASADELTVESYPSDILSSLYSNSINSDGNQLFWSDLYSYIFRANSAIEGLSASTKVTESVKLQLIGEAKFLRAFMYFYLVNLYGDAPLIINTDIKSNSVAPRVDRDLIYSQIISDLKDAEAGLNENYLNGDAESITNERVRPSKDAATALLARVYLYTGQWIEAEQASSILISNSGKFKLQPLNDVFLSSSKEAIWQLQPVGDAASNNLNTFDALTFVLKEGESGFPLAGPNSDSRPVYLSKQVYNAFEKEDRRKVIWVDSVKVGNTTYPYAYKYRQWVSGQPRTEYLMVFRLAEQYLIRAEARAQMEKVTGPNSAAADLDEIRERAGLLPTSASNKANMLAAIIRERQVELFTEWGHRWLDLKRTNVIDSIMNLVTPLKGGIWSPYKALYPIPISDIQRNPSLKGHQNPGYMEN